MLIRKILCFYIDESRKKQLFTNHSNIILEYVQKDGFKIFDFVLKGQNIYALKNSISFLIWFREKKVLFIVNDRSY